MFLAPISRDSRVKEAVFQAWRLAVVLVQLAGARSEVGRLRAAAGRRSNSIWRMNKEELVEVTHRELGMSYEEATRKTVLHLRELIRRTRSEATVEQNPLCRAPQGLDRMKKEDLQAECLNRDIITDATWTRPRMIVAIREDVEERVRVTSQFTAEVTRTTGRLDEMEDHGLVQRTQRSSFSRRRSHAETAQDWEDLGQQPRRSSSRVRIQDNLEYSRR